MGRLIAIGLLFAGIAAAQYVPAGSSGSIACVSAPGNTTGSYRQACQTSAGALWACNNAAGCTVAADWVSAAGSAFTFPGSGIPNSTGVGWGASFTLDTDSTMAANSDTSIPSQKAAKTALALKAPLALYPNTTPSAGQIGVGNAGGTAYAPVSLTQDCTIASTGVVTCLKTNNVAFGTAAVVNTGTSGATLGLLNGNLTFGGANAYGTPASIVLTNATGLPAAQVPTTPLATGTGATLVGPREYYVCTAACAPNPPVPVAGYEFCIVMTDNVAAVITLGALGSSAMYETTARTSYGTAGTGTLVSGGAVGDKVCLLGLNSTHYLTVSFTGAWVAN